MFAELKYLHAGQRPVDLQQPCGDPQVPAGLAWEQPAPSGVGDSCGSSACCRTAESVPGSSFIRQDPSSDGAQMDWLDAYCNSDQHDRFCQQLATGPMDPDLCVPVPHAPEHQPEPHGLQHPMDLDAVWRSAALASGYETGAWYSAPWPPSPVPTDQMPRCMPAALPVAALAADPAGSSSLQAVLYGASTASAAPGQQGHYSYDLPAPVVLGQLVSASSLCSSNTNFGPESTGGVSPGAGRDSSQDCNTCRCNLAQQIGCTLAAQSATSGKLPASARAMAAEVIAAAVACPRQCLITLQLPTESSGNSSSSSSIPDFLVSFAKARLGEEGGQRAPAGTATGRNFNFNCNAPIELKEGWLKALLGCQDSDKVFTVVSSDKRANLKAIAVTRLAVGISAAAADSNNIAAIANSSGSTSSGPESLWCSQAVTCSKTGNKYRDQVFDLYKFALFMPLFAGH